MANNNQDIIEKRMKEKQERIDQAIAMKEKSIAYFNSVNAAINLLSIDTELWSRTLGDDRKTAIIKWRDWFYSEWKQWYSLNATKPKEKKLTREDFAKAKREAPKSQAEQEFVNALMDEERIRREEEARENQYINLEE